MRWIYISPHLDDAALCAGGLIFDQSRAGAQVEIWTVMAGLPETEDLSDFAREMHARWSTGGARETILLRRREDLEAARILGASTVHMDFLDAIYRRGPNREPLYGDPVGAPVSQHDLALADRIADHLRRSFAADDEVVCLLGIGAHADHLLVRRAAESLGRSLHFVADFPYVLENPESVAAQAGSFREETLPISAAGVDAWTEAVHAYASQLGAVFEDLDPRQAIREYCAAHGGLRLWRPARLESLDSAPKP